MPNADVTEYRDHAADASAEECKDSLVVRKYFPLFWGRDEAVGLGVGSRRQHLVGNREVLVYMDREEV